MSMAPTDGVMPGGSDESAWPEDAIEVGRILDAWGVKGWVKVQAFSSDAQALFSSRRWFAKPPEANAAIAVRAGRMSSSKGSGM